MNKISIIILTLSFIIAGCSGSDKTTTDEHTNVKTERMSGYFMYMADAARFIDCKSNISYPVSMKEEYLQTERQYLKLVDEPAEMIFITFDGYFEKQQKVDYEGLEDAVVIFNLIDIDKGKKCE